MEKTTKASPPSLRWSILRRALLPHRRLPQDDEQSRADADHISRKNSRRGFNLIPFEAVTQRGDPDSPSTAEAGRAVVRYTLPVDGSPGLLLTQRLENQADLHDFEICNTYNVDNTGLVCSWPSEEVLAYFCLSHADMFRCKKVIELGSGYGLAGLVIAAATEASEVVISDGNPQVVDYIKCNIDANLKMFGGTKVMPMMLHWNQTGVSEISNSYDIIVASDCTFFKEFHSDLARMIKSLLKQPGPSESILLSPKRGDSLDKFLYLIAKEGLRFSVTENYDSEIWKRHQGFVNGDDSWPGYQKDHCYPLLVRIMHESQEPYS
ncbi:calmodulin-lysine N-methyltransferase [Eucalyptus grandis]|uniref:Uncharacterized protein n=2 Tax=Eucalyptus grandis TaxID=71139 RepID=A0ACC3JJB8_EUCGR|nr:calmodulin-lysine N-methyltransferase [Eucalyptus grandis]KAK3413790.1 hypothetical protein EUGRSUZ_I02338 [Eucalyptus grandis]